MAPIHYLVALKLAADRSQDLADLEQLLAQGTVDYRRARAIVAQHLGPYAAQRLDKLARAQRRADVPADYGDPAASRVPSRLARETLPSLRLVWPSAPVPPLRAVGRGRRGPWRPVGWSSGAGGGLALCRVVERVWRPRPGV